jgi:hypothetical protein
MGAAWRVRAPHWCTGRPEPERPNVCHGAVLIVQASAGLAAAAAGAQGLPA